MSVIKNDSLKNCFVHNQYQIKSQFGFRILFNDANEQLIVDSLDRHMFVFLTKGEIIVSIDSNKPIYITQPHLFLLPELSKAKINILSSTNIIIYCFKELSSISSTNNFTELYLFEPQSSAHIRSLPLQLPFITFLKTIEDVLSLGGACTSYHRLKAKELFFLLNTYYSPVDLALLLEPLICENFRLKTFVYRNYQGVDTVNELVEKSGMSRTQFFE